MHGARARARLCACPCSVCRSCLVERRESTARHANGTAAAPASSMSPARLGRGSERSSVIEGGHTSFPPGVLRFRFRSVSRALTQQAPEPLRKRVPLDGKRKKPGVLRVLYSRARFCNGSYVIVHVQLTKPALISVRPLLFCRVVGRRVRRLDQGPWATCNKQQLTYWHCFDDEQWKRVE